MAEKVLMCLQGLRPGARAPTTSPLEVIADGSLLLKDSEKITSVHVF